MVKPIIELKDVWKVYEMGEIEVPALKGINLKVMPSEFLVIIGSSGSGKSTMMNLVGCLDTPTKGDVYLKDINIFDLSESKLAQLRGKTIGFIFQQYNLIPTMSAYDNVVLPLDLLDVDEKIAKENANKILDKVGLSDKHKNLPSQLSGGQQQRVSIARSLVTNPDIILADEPTGALDSVTGKEVLETLSNLWKKEKKTIIMVTHDLKLAHYGSRIIVLKDGKIVNELTSKELENKDIQTLLV